MAAGHESFAQRSDDAALGVGSEVEIVDLAVVDVASELDAIISDLHTDRDSGRHTAIYSALSAVPER